MTAETTEKQTTVADSIVGLAELARTIASGRGLGVKFSPGESIRLIELGLNHQARMAEINLAFQQPIGFPPFGPAPAPELPEDDPDVIHQPTLVEGN